MDAAGITLTTMRVAVRRCLGWGLALVGLVVGVGVGEAGPAADTELAVAIRQVERQSADELKVSLERSSWKSHPLFLAAVVQNPNATSAMLEGITRRDDPGLHAKLLASRALLGKNQRGLAVMRLVTMHPNVTTPILERLAESKDDHVVHSVLRHPRTPEAVLRRFAGRGNQLYDWGLAQNPKTPAELLEPLAGAANATTRAMVARNPATPVALLPRLAGDKDWMVRRDVARHPQAPREVLERLAGDADPLVQRAAEVALRARPLPAR